MANDLKEVLGDAIVRGSGGGSDHEGVYEEINGRNARQGLYVAEVFMKSESGSHFSGLGDKEGIC